jgi:hypothetical protein
MRTTALIGSGATIDIGGPTTKDLTDAVCCRNVFLSELRNEVSDFVAPAICTFEDLFHVLETLLSYASAFTTGVLPEYKPRPAAVLATKDSKWLNVANILRASECNAPRSSSSTFSRCPPAGFSYSRCFSAARSPVHSLRVG